jgi:hypothetical protein
MTPGGRRLLLAFGVSIAVHEILAGLVPPPASSQTAREVVTRVASARIEIRPTPTPRPPPTPAPQRVVARVRVIAPSETRTVARTVTGHSARKEIVRRAGAARPRPLAIAHTKPVWDIPTGGQGAGAGTVAGAGSLGNGGSGTGAGANGNGNGAAAGNEPCGFVTFSDPHGSHYDAATGGFWVDIRLTVRYPDGHSESTVLDYSFYYPDEASNPWSDRNLGKPFPTTFQFPPPEKRANELPLVQYVMAHTSSDGYTLLKDCP